MENRLERMQILMARNQRQRLVKLANVQKRSLSELIREAVDYYLEREEIQYEQARRAIQRIKAVRESLLLARHDQPVEIDLVNLIHQMREERADELGGQVSGH